MKKIYILELKNPTYFMSISLTAEKEKEYEIAGYYTSRAALVRELKRIYYRLGIIDDAKIEEFVYDYGDFNFRKFNGCAKFAKVTAVFNNTRDYKAKL